LPYGGVHALGRRDWTETWGPLQDDRERVMDPHVIAASDSQVVVLWQQRGHAPSGERFEMPVLGLYEVRDEKLARAQMFYYDSHAVREFLMSAQRDTR
jgi:ketosteroid isomerase-like protein